MLGSQSYQPAIEAAQTFFATLISAGYPASQFQAQTGYPAPYGLVSFNRDDSRVIGSIWKGDPSRFQGLYPAMIVPEPSIGGSPGAEEWFTPGMWDFDIQFIEPTMASAPDVDGRLEAQAKTRAAATMFLDALSQNTDMDGEATAITFVASAAGDVDRLGNARVDRSIPSILWVHSLRIRVHH